MKMRALLPLALLVFAAALTPAHADGWLYADRLDAVHVNAYRPTDSRTSSSSSSTAAEVSIAVGKLEVLADTAGYGYPEEGGCISIYQNGVLDDGCGQLTIQPDAVMGATRVTGVLETTAYTISFEEIGPSSITVDLLVTGTGPVERSPFTNYGVGVCGLGPETEGVFVDLRPELQREASISGTLTSQEGGAVDVTVLPALLVRAFGVQTGACL